VSPRTVVFVADTNGDLTDHETFPTGRQIKLRISTAVQASNGRFLREPALACSTVGADTLRPEVSTTPPPINSPVITPGLGDNNAARRTDIRIDFTEPLQPLTLGSLPSGHPPVLSAAVRVTFGPSAQTVNVPFSIMPASVFDLSTYVLTPA